MSSMTLPPGFRFHPTDDELVSYYLKRKVEGQEIELEVIPVIELYKFDPWELPDKSFMPKKDMEWFFFCPRDRKYPNGSRTNRATASGYWKATGKDRKVICESSVYGLRKTLVFYRGRAPGGERTDWVMHEYRLCENFSQITPNFLGAFALCHIVKRNELGLKNTDVQDEHRAKRCHPSSLSTMEPQKCCKRGSSCSKEDQALLVDLSQRSNDSTPITSNPANEMSDEIEAIVTETDQASFWGSNIFSDVSEAFSEEHNIFSQSIVPAKFPSSVKPYIPYDLSSASSCKDITVDAYLADDFNGNSGTASLPNPLHCMDMYSNVENMEFPTIQWNPPPFMNESSNGTEAWNPMLSTICRQESEEEANLWFQEDNFVISI